MNKMIPIACLALIGAAASQAYAQQAEAAPETPQDGPVKAAPAPAGKLQQVTVPGSRANDIETRRLSTASKMIFGREELDRNGDSSVGEILKRLPGVTMGGRPGRGGGVRMRGLGNGYTQMLVNGEKPPGGFSLEQLSPDQVERIEIIRGPVAEHSTQAIAGTINIVLREGYQQKDISLKLTDNTERGRHGGNVSLTVPGKVGKLTWLLNGSIFENRQHNESSTRSVDATDAGEVTRDQVAQDQNSGRSRGIHLSPRLSYRFDNSDTLTFQPFLVSNRNTSTSESDVTQSVGLRAPEYALQLGDSRSTSTFMRGFGNWVHKMDAGAKLDVKFGFGGGRSDSDTLRRTFDSAGAPKKTYTDSDATRDHGLSTGGKYTTPLGKGHLLAAGWDVEANHRSQTHVALQTDDILADDSGANLSADTRRVAAFVQDEWDITPQWSAYVGLRWEGIRTNSTSGGADVSNTSRVWSPVLHTVWRIPGHEKDQIRAALTQSYRAPSLNDLIATPSISTDNQATRPDRMGNPNLKPELAKGLDVAYEHYLGKSGIVSASAFVRDIDNLMRRTTTQQLTTRGLRWVSSPVNIGHAITSGVELEAKFPITEVLAGAPNIDLRSNYSRFWSRVDGIPGPNNRLDQQPSQTANLGFDYRMKVLPLTVGGGYNWTPAIVVQTAASEQVSTGVKRQLDVYGLWKFSASTQLRLAANNLLARDYDNGRIIGANGMVLSGFSTAHTYAMWSIKLEMKL
ncbi:MAG TPA: TonB-dependent receptor [Telluria sp.]|nr:TonB-dependent receptor [Telluria sp.]